MGKFFVCCFLPFFCIFYFYECYFSHLFSWYMGFVLILSCRSVVLVHCSTFQVLHHLLACFLPTISAAGTFYACLFFLFHEQFWAMLFINIISHMVDLHFLLPQLHILKFFSLSLSFTKLHNPHYFFPTLNYVFHILRPEALSLTFKIVQYELTSLSISILRSSRPQPLALAIDIMDYVPSSLSCPAETAHCVVSSLKRSLDYWNYTVPLRTVR